MDVLLLQGTRAKTFLAELRRRAYVNGLAISGTPVGNNFCLPPGAKRDEQIAHVSQEVDRYRCAARLTDDPRVCRRAFLKGSPVDEARALAVAGLKETAAYAGERGVILALENHGGITARAKDLLYLVDAVASPWLGVNLDTGNFHADDPYLELERAAPYAVSVQVKVEVRGPDRVSKATDYDRIVSILKNANYRGYVALEYEAKEPAKEAVPHHLAALRSAVEKTG